MSLLPYISDVKLLECFQNLLNAISDGKEKAENGFERNTIDPFSTLLEMALFDCDGSSWIKSETRRQAQKSLTNAIGTFHQQILGNVDGWRNLGTTNQVDLANDDKKILAEIKNKHNTLKASEKSALYKRLSDMISKKNSIFKDYTAYYVEIIPKNSKSYNKIFTPSDSSTGSRCPEDEKIRCIDGRSFYSLVTGDTEAIDKLFAVLPDLIARNGFKLQGDACSVAKEYFIKAYTKK